MESKEKIPTSKPQAVEESHKPISSKGRHSSKERSTEPAKIVDPIVTKPAESETELPASVDMLSSDAEIFVKNEEDSIQFMGEVESLLQEHGIEIETEKRNKSSDRRKVNLQKDSLEFFQNHINCSSIQRLCRKEVKKFSKPSARYGYFVLHLFL